MGNVCICIAPRISTAICVLNSSGAIISMFEDSVYKENLIYYDTLEDILYDAKNRAEKIRDMVNFETTSIYDLEDYDYHLQSAAVRRNIIFHCGPYETIDNLLNIIGQLQYLLTKYSHQDEFYIFYDL